MKIALSEYLRHIGELIASKKKFWEKIYDNKETHWLKKEVSLLTKSVVKKYGPFKNVLEIGSAGGIDTFYLAKHTKKITGIDIVEDAVEIANFKLKEQNKNIRKKIKFQVGDAEKLEFPDSKFDLVYSLSVLHTTDISKSLKEIDRVLTDNGHAVLYVLTEGKFNKNRFLDTCRKYFIIENKDEVFFKDKDEKHKALIVFLRKK